MVDNFPGPYELRIYYTTTTANRQHRQNLNLDLASEPTVGETFDNILAVTKAAGNVALDTAVDAWVVLLQPLFKDDSTIVSAELWKYEFQSYEASYKASYAIAAAGTEDTTPATPAGEAIGTLRTQEGGIMKIVLEESIMPIAVTQSYPSTYTLFNALIAFVISDDSWILARDTSYPIVGLRVHPGQNEAWFKKIYRGG